MASVSAFGASSGETIAVVSIQPDGQTTTVGDDNQPRRAQLSAPDVERVQRCIDESGFLDLADGFTGSNIGSAGGDKWCAVSDAAVVTVTATGSSGGSRTASGISPGFEDTDCDFGYPDGLVRLHAGLVQVQAAVTRA